MPYVKPVRSPSANTTPTQSNFPSLASTPAVPSSPTFHAGGATLNLNSTEDLAFTSTPTTPTIPQPDFSPAPSSLSKAPRDPTSSSNRSDASLTRMAAGIPNRSSSLRRKPVPSLLPQLDLPIPSSHPFAQHPTSATSSTASTPGLKDEGDLFYRSPSAMGEIRKGGPVPPRRTHTPAHSGSSKASIGNSETVSRDLVPESGAPFATNSGARTPLVKPSVVRESSPVPNKALPPLPVQSVDSFVTAPAFPSSTTSLPQGYSQPMSRAPESQSATSSTATTTTTSSSMTVPATPRAQPPISLAPPIARSAGTPPRTARPGPSRLTSWTPGPGRDGEVSLVKANGAKATAEEFSVDRLPSKETLLKAGTMFVKDEDGRLVCVGDFFPRYPQDTTLQGEKLASQGAEKAEADPSLPPITKTVLFFIRHFWCGQCQDYTFASLSLLDPVAIRRAGVRVIIISNGSWKIIKSYKKLFNCPFPIYVDGPRGLYQMLGMTKMTNDFGPLFKGRASYHQRNVPGQLVQSLGNALFRLPLADPGKLTQLGGEFILTPGLECTFAHRMTTTSDHMEAPDVMRLAGVSHPTSTEVREITLVEEQRLELERIEKEMASWRATRASELDRIRQRKAARRGEVYISPSHAASQSEFGGGLDAELGMEGEYADVSGGRGGFMQAHAEGMDFGDGGDEDDMAEYEHVGKPDGVAVKDDGMEKRFREVMRLDEAQREDEHRRAKEFAMARGRGNLEVRVGE